MEEIEFKLRGKVVRLGREIKGINAREFSKIVDIEHRYLSKLERETANISKLNEIRILRGLRQIGVTDQQIASIQLIVEHEEGKFDEV
jgi:transcriptional regulator with XRE-family HTH domain